ncbi:PAS-domain containing protein [Roseicitreum antarcticum]|uniref:histidine kinase n=1 Tax=Roseicitreum antarcticum TaxID=564137 RepID=A0A1H2XIM3_9RHOB|nr:PAS-domain containing protein [Roseicitreum antarcticum]SDW92314.1 Response regulator receiver domain-containing protein [Roseicitreum antarcticum]
MAVSGDLRIRLMGAGLNMIQQALSIFDSDLRLAVSNQRYQEMFDLPDWLVTPGARFEDTIDYLVGRGEYGPQADPDAAVRQRVEAARAFAPHYMERQRANGRWISVEGAPLAPGGWVTVYTDITEIKHQERLLRARSEELSDQVLAHAERLSAANRALAATNAALEEAKRDLTEIEARTRLTTEMMPAHIAHMDREMHYTYSNRRLSSVMPGRPRDIVGLHARDALGGAFDKILPYLCGALDGTSSVYEFTDDASGRRIRLALTPDQVAAGPINGIYVLSMDVTQETQARAALTQTRKRELAASLSSGLAHDFANLLTIIMGLQGRMLRQTDLPADQADMVRATVAAAHRGGALLDRIAQISVHRDLKPGATDIARLLEDLSMMARPALYAGTDLMVLLEDRFTLLLLDAGAVQDSLLNLILNARDAIGTAGGRIRVTARRVQDTWLELQVEDTGPGFSAQALERGLDPFFTTKGGEGSGLGLAMVFDQTTLAGGNVRLANRASGGAVVTLRLPLRSVGADATPKLVLLVEDSAEIRAEIRTMLRDLGHTVIEAATAVEAAQLAELPGVEIVLSDINLPGGMTGLDLGRRVRDTGRAVVRLMTSRPLRDGLRLQAAAEFPVISKPFGRDELMAHLAAEGR